MFFREGRGALRPAEFVYSVWRSMNFEKQKEKRGGSKDPERVMLDSCRLPPWFVNNIDFFFINDLLK